MPKTTTHPVTEIQGIGPAIARDLASRNIVFAEDLLAVSAKEMAARVETVKRLTAHNLENNFIPQARFLRLDEINGQFAEGLVASGYRTYRDLVNSRTETIVGALSNRADEGLIPAPPQPDEVISWQLAAAQRVGTGFLHLTVFDDATGKRLAGANVRINGLDSSIRTPVNRETEERGLAFFESLVPGRHTAVITADGYLRQAATFSIESDGAVQIRIRMKAGVHKPRVIDEFAGDAIHVIGRQDAVESRRVKIEDLDPRPPAHVIEVRKDTVLLSSIWRRKIDDIVEVLTFLLPEDELPANLSKGDVLIPQDNGKYELSDMTLLEYRKKFLSERPPIRYPTRR